MTPPIRGGVDSMAPPITGGVDSMTPPIRGGLDSMTPPPAQSTSLFSRSPPPLVTNNERPPNNDFSHIDLG